MNAPAAFDSFLVADGDRKVEVVRDTKLPQVMNITVHKEDHTLANLLKTQLLKNPKVIFCGYKVPHPMEHLFVLRIQTCNIDYSPIEAVQSAITELIGELSTFETRFKEAAKTKKDLG